MGCDGGHRSEFGTVIARKKKDGSIVSYIGRYAVAGRRYQASFGPDGEQRARDWLASERERVLSAGKEPNRKSEDSGITFAAYADDWADRHRKRNGTELKGHSMRNLRDSVNHLKRAFPEPLLLEELTSEIISKWYNGPHPEGPWAFHSACKRLRSILQSACVEGIDGSAPLLDKNPFERFPIPPEPKVAAHDAPPVSAVEIAELYHAMPDYTRITILLSACAGGLRTGELCGLRVGDVDLEGRRLHVRHSVDRGKRDKGPQRICETKTARSNRTVPLPEAIIPYLEEHMRRWCDLTDPMSPLIVPKKAEGSIPRNSLDGQLFRARQRCSRKDVQFRMLRATHATMFLVEGGTLREAMDQLGHVNEHVAVHHYQRVIPSHRAEIAERTATSLMAGLPARQSKQRDSRLILDLSHTRCEGQEEGTQPSGTVGGDTADLLHQLNGQLRTLTEVLGRFLNVSMTTIV